MLLIRGVYINEDDGSGLIPVGKCPQGTVVITCQCKLARISKVRSRKWWAVPDPRDKVWSVVIYSKEEEVARPVVDGSRILAVKRATALCDELFPKVPRGGSGQMPYPSGYKYLD